MILSDIKNKYSFVKQEISLFRIIYNEQIILGLYSHNIAVEKKIKI